MPIVDDLVSSLVERNEVRLNGKLTVRLLEGALKVQGSLFSTLRDTKKNRDLLNVSLPVDADLRVSELVIAVPKIP